MSVSGQRSLFDLLPAVYRLRDADQNASLQNLMTIFQDVLQSLDLDVSNLYENWFIETCAEWVVPYIGDLLRTRPLYAADPNTFSARSYVAHTLSYRRRKGTVVVLEQLARDATGWPARAVEFFQLLATAQYVNHLRLDNVGSPDLRRTNALELLGGPFEAASHSVDVRGIVGPPLDPSLAADLIDDRQYLRGKYNIPNIGIFLWRLQSYAVRLATPRPVDGSLGADGRYWFHPLGLDEPLFNLPKTLPAFTHLASETNVPDKLRRRALYDELEARRQTLVDQYKVWMPRTTYPAGAEIVDSFGNTEQAMNAGTSGAGPNPPTWPNSIGGQVSDGSITTAITWKLVAKGFSFPGASYFGDQPVLQIYPGPGSNAVPPEQIMICDLSSPPPPPSNGPWRTPPSKKDYIRSSDGVRVTLPIQASVDPVLGRLAFASGSIPTNTPSGANQVQVRVSYLNGFSGDLAGGPYNRTDSVVGGDAFSALRSSGNPFWGAVVTQGTLPPGNAYSSLTAAVAAWNSLTGPGSQPLFGIIAILDSCTYVESLVGANQNQIVIPDASTLLIVSAEWLSRRGGTGTKTLDLVPSGLRPHLRGNISVYGSASATSNTPGTLILNGLLIEGSATVVVGNLGGLQIVHSTITPSQGLTVDSSNSLLNVVLNRSICGPIKLPIPIPTLSITDSIIDAGTVGGLPGLAISAPGADINIQSSTVLGSTGTATAYGGRSLGAGNSIFSALVNIERTQAGCLRFCSFPSDVSKTPRRYHCQPDLALDGITDPSLQAPIRDRVAPSFTSTSYGDPGYAQLSSSCAIEIRSGADNRGEMGAFYFLKQTQRDTNLRIAFLEYLRFGLQAGIFYVT